MRLTYLKQHYEGFYTGLLLSGRLNAHLNEINKTTYTSIELITKQMKAKDQMT